MNTLLDFLKNDGTKNAELNAKAVERGYNPFIPGDSRHAIVNCYQNEKNKIEINLLNKLLGNSNE